MAQRERELDPHSLLFGGDEDDFSGDFGDPRSTPRLTRADRRRDEHHHRRRKHRRRGRLFVLLALVLVAAVAVFVVPRVVDYFRTKDFSGAEGPTVRVTVRAGDSASDIGKTLYGKGVVASEAAFTDAAAANPKAQNIQPGTYVLRTHMSGANALTLLLNPTSRDSTNDVVVTEGATVVDVEKGLVKVLGPGKRGAVVKAIESSSALGLPIDYRTGRRRPVSSEGFLYPATYTIDPTTAPVDILQKMVTRFTAQDRSTGFTDAARKLRITPYQALIIASIAQAEAKYAADMPKVARVILNRIKAGRPLQIDATSAYAGKLKGLDPTKTPYAAVKGPYNTYNHTGLPPTPIDNPGSAAMDAAVHPAAGTWLYYVNGDRAGHLFFTPSEKQFAAAATKCRQRHWGCG